MTRASKKTTEEIRREDLQRVADFRWIDDTFARVAFKGQAKIRRLIHDFKCRKADDMYFPDLARRTREIKGDQKEVERMCMTIENMRKETERVTEQRTILRDIKSVMKTFGVPMENAMDALDIPNEERKLYASVINAQATR